MLATLATLALMVAQPAPGARPASQPAPPRPPASRPAPSSLPASYPRRPPAAPTPLPEQIVAVAEGYLGAPYVFGGRNGRPGCRQGRRRVRCQPGIDCQSLIFFAYEKVCGRPWTAYSVTPSVSAQRRELGDPVPGLDGVLRPELDRSQLRTGDVLFFLLEDYNLDADRPLMERDGHRYGVWHTGLYHGVADDVARVLHARPGDRVVVEPLDDISFDALYVLRLPDPRRCPRP